jgi:hypothetical protein
MRAAAPGRGRQVPRGARRCAMLDGVTRVRGLGAAVGHTLAEKKP